MDVPSTTKDSAEPDKANLPPAKITILVNYEGVLAACLSMEKWVQIGDLRQKMAERKKLPSAIVVLLGPKGNKLRDEDTIGGLKLANDTILTMTCGGPDQDYVMEKRKEMFTVPDKKWRPKARDRSFIKERISKLREKQEKEANRGSLLLYLDADHYDRLLQALYNLGEEPNIDELECTRGLMKVRVRCSQMRNYWALRRISRRWVVYRLKKETPAGPKEERRPKEYLPKENEVEEALDFDQWEIVKSKGDGNCLFRSVAQEVYGDQLHHDKVRQEVADHIVKETGYYFDFIDHKDGFNAYIAELRTNGEWGGDIELQAASELYNKRVLVYSLDKDSRMCLRKSFHEQVPGTGEPLRLLFSGSHYDAVVEWQVRYEPAPKRGGKAEDLQAPAEQAGVPGGFSADRLAEESATAAERTGANEGVNRATARPAAEGNSAHLPTHQRRRKARTVVTTVPIQRIVHVKENMVIWVVNVRSISGLTDASSVTKDKIKETIEQGWPEAIIMLETNHRNRVDLLDNYYDSFSTAPAKDRGVVIMTKKLLACSLVEAFEDRGIAVRSNTIEGFTIVGSYCPYASLVKTTIDFVTRSCNGFWFLGADWENFGETIIKEVQTGVWKKPEFSRSRIRQKARNGVRGVLHGGL